MQIMAGQSGVDLIQGVDGENEVIKMGQQWAISEELRFETKEVDERKFNPEVLEAFFEMIQEEVLEYKQGGKPEFILFEDKIVGEDGKEVEFSIHGPQAYVSSISGINFEQHLNREAIDLTEILKNTSLVSFVKKAFSLIHDKKAFREALKTFEKRIEEFPKSKILFKNDEFGRKRFAGIDVMDR